MEVDLVGDQADTSTSGSRRENLAYGVRSNVTSSDITVDEAILS